MLNAIFLRLEAFALDIAGTRLGMSMMTAKSLLKTRNYTAGMICNVLCVLCTTLSTSFITSSMCRTTMTPIVMNIKMRRIGVKIGEKMQRHRTTMLPSKMTYFMI